MDSTKIRQKLYEYIRVADDGKIEGFRLLVIRFLPESPA